MGHIPTRRWFLLGTAATLAAAGHAAWQGARKPFAPRPEGDEIDVRAFGASPAASPEANTRAFAAAGALLSRRGGGTLLIPPGEYLVGGQEAANGRGRGYAFRGRDILTIEGCSAPVRVVGTGARLKLRPGLRFGSFDPSTGAPHRPKLPFYDREYGADAGSMVVVRRCSGPVRIEGLELDGNLSQLVVGGEWGDVGRQLAAIGILLVANTGDVVIANVNSHHHGQDGIMVVHHHLTDRSPRYQVTLLDSVFDSNGRQGLSWVGGTGLTAERCRFSRTGRAGIMSPPGAGVDIEAELSVCRNGRFIECEFSDNAGVGLLAEAGDAADIVVERCTLIGTTNWSAWPKKPRMTFDRCLFVGAIVNVFASDDPEAATKFRGCRFRADRSLSPTGRVHGTNLADLGGGATNVVMNDCEFDALTPDVALPWSGGDVTYNDCRFRQVGGATSYPRGIYTGRNMIVSAGKVELDGSNILGELIVNGRRI